MTEEEREQLLTMRPTHREQIRQIQNESKEILRKKFPIVGWLPHYNWYNLQCDFIAGLTVALTLIPQALAYAKLAGLPTQYGLYSSFMGCFVYCLFGTAKDITIGPTAIMSIMTVSFTASPIPNDPTYAVILTLIAGIVQFFMGLFNLGFLIRFISGPVLISYTSAAAIIIASSQLKNIFGLKVTTRSFFPNLYYTFAKIGETNFWDLTLGICCIILIQIIKKFRNIDWGDDADEIITSSQRFARYILWIFGTAANCVVVVTAAAVAAAITSFYPNQKTFTLTEEIKGGLPPFKIPNFSIHQGNISQTTSEIFSNIGVGFFIIPFNGIIETIAIGKSFARKNCYKLDATQELVALGIANILSSFVSSYPVAGSFSRTAINSESGVKTPASGLITGSVVLVALVFLAPAFRFIPSAALAAVIICAVFQMLEVRVIKKLWKIHKFDFFIYLVTLISSFALSVAYGILIGIGISLIQLLYPLSQPKIMTIQTTSIPVINLEFGLQFPAAEYFEDQVIDIIDINAKPKAVILDCKNIFCLDYTAIKSIEKMYAYLESHKIDLVITGLKENVKARLLTADDSLIRYSSSVEDAMEELSKE